MKSFKHFIGFLFCVFTGLFYSCNFFNTITGGEIGNVSITNLTLEKRGLALQVGEMDYISVKIKPDNVQKNVHLNWEYDDSIISCDTSSPWGITITGIKEGKTSLKCSYNGFDAVCMITVAGYAPGYTESVEPYIYSNTNILTTAPGVTERIYVSLYGGTAADIEGYNWTVDNPSIATINPSGQYCLITAKDSGYTRIKVTHTKSAYPYYIGVYVFADSTNVTYITTSSNILTMNLADSERTIDCNLINGKDTSLDSSFKWQIIPGDNGEVPVRINSINNQTVVTPIRNGSCTIRVTHPDALYPLDILCRVITVVENVYIQPDNTIATISGTQSCVITSDLIGLKEGEYNFDDYSYTINNTEVAEIASYVGNQVMIKGKKNGSCKLIISHPKAAYTREVLLIVNGQIADAVDASCYITTNQNYIKTKIGADPVELMITLKGGEDSDAYTFNWSVESNASDGSGDNVIELVTSNGTTSYRAASSNYTDGKALIKPLKEGTAVITLTNPKVEYPTEVLVKVFGEQAILEQPLYFTGSGIVYLLNGESTTYETSLYGNSYNANDNSLIKWDCDNSYIQIIANGNVAQITAPAAGSGSRTSWLTLSHPKAESKKSILIITADTLEELHNYKALYSDKLYFNLEVDKTTDIILNYVGFDQYDDEGNLVSLYDFSTLTWTVDEPSICYIEKLNTNPLLCKIKGLRAGTTKVHASINSYNCDFTVTVYPQGTVNIEEDVYLTTSQNVISIDKAGKTAKAYISAVKLPVNKYSEIVWTVDNPNIATIQDNGVNAVITAIAEGETIVTVSHPLSANSLKIYVRIGSEYIIKDAEPTCYISAPDVLTLLKNEPASTLQAILVNYAGTDTSGFTFVSDNPDIASISAQSTNGVAYIKPVTSGQAEITISHSAAEFSKKVLVVVGNSQEELAGIKYLTTSSNVVAVGEGNTKSVSVSVKNSDDVVVDGYSWSSSNPSVVDVTGSGASAILTGNSIGTCIITVTNKNCQYPLTIIAQCVDPIAAAANPYIQLTSSVQLLTVSPSYTSVTAELVGGNESDKSGFIWQSNDTSICVVYGQNEVGKIRALKAGTTYITVSHPKSNYSAQLLVVCDEAVKSECSISVGSSIITMKPTDNSQLISATLVNGNETDKYNFKWSMDVYDVIDLIYSGNQATITPKQTGTCTITISHPRAAYDQQIIVRVDEYTTFGFPEEAYTTTRGDVSFISMQVPSTNQTSHIEYSVDDSSKCSITGTKSIAQITAINSGTTIVRAKLVATSTNAILAQAEMMIYIKEAEVNVNYISSASTIYTVNKGKSQTLSAVISGADIKANDQYDFKWTTNDTDIIKISGIGADGTVTGQSVYITALSPGEALITCSHPKAQSSLQFYIMIPGTEEKRVTLNKTYITLTKGSSGSPVKATIENSISADDYSEENLRWTAELKDGVEICRVMGNGQTVTIYPVTVGETYVTAQLSNGSIAKCTVVVEAGKSFNFETSSKVVQPFHSKTVKYIVSPPDASLMWTTNQGDDYFSYNDLGCDSSGVGYVEITGIREGSGTLYCVANSNIKAQLNVKCAWDYSFAVDSTVITGTPGETSIIEYYNLNPSDAKISIESNFMDYFNYGIKETDVGKGEISIIPLKEFNTPIDIIITAKNPINNDIVGSKIIKAKFDYANLSVKASFINSDGNFSRLNEDSSLFIIGDGENVELKFSIEEQMSNGTIKSVSFVPKVSTYKSLSIERIASGDKYEIYKFSHEEDYIENVYKITKATKPCYYTKTKSVRVYDEDGNWTYVDVIDETSGVEILNWKKDFVYETTTVWPAYDYTVINSTTYHQSGYSNCYYWKADTGSEGFGNRFYEVDNPDEVGAIYTEDEFKSILWYYRPSHYWKGSGIQNTVSVGEKIWHCAYDILPTTSKAVINYELIGNVVVIISHNGIEQKKIEYPVYLEKRNCTKLQD
ncbi:MAG: Ig-like domain-containing protein [Treponema sp.]|nr:Ig-like domain-containing protein [Treponema sp.]